MAILLKHWLGTLLLFSTVSATVILRFEAAKDIELMDESEKIYANAIELRVEVEKCSTTVCSCKVTTNTTQDREKQVRFSKNKPNLGAVVFEYLEPNTLYSFQLTCQGATEPMTRQYTTDNGRPSEPRNIQVSLEGVRLKVSWCIPEEPAGLISSYQLTINDQRHTLGSNQFHYETKEEFIWGKEYEIVVQACNKNRVGDDICSIIEKGQRKFFQQTTTTTSTTTTTTITIPPTTTTTTTLPIEMTTTTTTTVTTTTTETPQNTGFAVRTASTSFSLLGFTFIVFFLI